MSIVRELKLEVIRLEGAIQDIQERCQEHNDPQNFITVNSKGKTKKAICLFCDKEWEVH